MSKSTDERYTKPKHIQKITNVLETIDLDPVAAPFLEAQNLIGAKYVYTEKDNCLLQDWSELPIKTVYMNPPFSNSHLFINKFIDELYKQSFEVGITLTLSSIIHNKRTADDVFQNVSIIAPCRGRISFLMPDENDSLIDAGNQMSKDLTFCLFDTTSNSKYKKRFIKQFKDICTFYKPLEYNEL